MADQGDNGAPAVSRQARSGKPAGRATTVPFTDLAAMASEVWPSIETDYLTRLLGGGYVGGSAVAGFEREWAAYCGAGHAVGVGSGTDALQLALAALGIGPGDEVVIPASTFIATAAAVVRAGAAPRFADVSDDTLLLTPGALAEAITPRTRAAVVVHLFGQMPDMAALAAVAAEAGIWLVEDAAQAHGAEWDGRRAGSFGDAATFSFYPGKNLGAFGDAGAVVTSRPEVAARVRALANHGRPDGDSHHEHRYLGTNSRLDALQATVLSGKLARLETWTSRRIALAARYRALLADANLKLTGVAPRARHVYHLFVVRVARRDRVRAELARQGIRTGVHYPVPCHLQPPLRRFAARSLPVAERAAGEVLSLPMFPHLTDGQVDTVCAVLADAIRTTGAGSWELIDVR
ncbi:MAG: DegT/DnrJ/EryC1/StrS family aminotransferase [Actinobacteria bacterium]|nr:DegT/DnrJ/EryC1/StrS family aminotransferase [Actinomycetota bacterium]MBO0786526.1 DegT/DnrJ/EryC1/StrS family aminotransferase [Actinomycetota bacterium]